MGYRLLNSLCTMRVERLYLYKEYLHEAAESDKPVDLNAGI